MQTAGLFVAPAHCEGRYTAHRTSAGCKLWATGDWLLWSAMKAIDHRARTHLGKSVIGGRSRTSASLIFPFFRILSNNIFSQTIILVVWTHLRTVLRFSRSWSFLKVKMNSSKLTGWQSAHLAVHHSSRLTDMLTLSLQCAEFCVTNAIFFYFLLLLPSTHTQLLN